MTPAVAKGKIWKPLKQFIKKKEALIGFEPMIEAYFLGLLKSLILLFDA